MTEPDRCSAPYRVRFDECRPDGRIRTSVLLRYTQDLAGYHSDRRGFGRAWYAERGITWLVRAAEVEVLEPIGIGAELVGTTQVAGWRRVWARRRTDFRDADGTLVAEVRIDWVLLDARGVPTRIPAEFEPAFGAAPTSVGLLRVDLGEVPAAAAPLDAHGPPAGARPDGSRQQRGLRGLARRGDPGRGRRRRRSGRSRGWRGWNTPGRPRPARRSASRSGADGEAWSCRLADADGDLLRARLEPLAGHAAD